MNIKLKLSEQEQHWLEQIAEYRQMSAEDAIKLMLKEQHEQMTMELAFDRFPQGEKTISQAETDSRSARKAQLKKSLIERARGQNHSAD